MGIHPFYRLHPPVPAFYNFSQVLQLYEDKAARKHHQPIPDPDPEYDMNPLEPEASMNDAADDVNANASSKEKEDPSE